MAWTLSCVKRIRLLPQGRPAGVLIAPLLGAAALLLAQGPAAAQQAGYGQTLGSSPLERQLYEGGGGRPSSGSILDSTNPIDLMNRIRRGTAMDEATPPASAIDAALQQLEIQSSPAQRGDAASGPSSQRPPAAGQPGVEAVPMARPLATSPLGTLPAAPASAPQGQTRSLPLNPAL